MGRTLGLWVGSRVGGVKTDTGEKLGGSTVGCDVGCGTLMMIVEEGRAVGWPEGALVGTGEGGAVVGARDGTCVGRRTLVGLLCNHINQSIQSTKTKIIKQYM